MKRGLRSVIGTVLVLGALGGGAYYAYGKLRADGKTAPARTVTAERGDLVEVANASGTIAPHVQVEVKSRGSGEVIEVLVQEGQTVEAGALLVRLDPADAERALKQTHAAQRRIEADLTAAHASLTVSQLEARNARVTHELNEKGAGLGLVSSDTTRTTANAAQVAAANVRLRQANATASAMQLELAKFDVQDAERRLTELNIFAPLGGTVLSVDVERGTIVASAVTNVGGGTPVVTIADLTDLRVIGSIDEAQIGRVAVGQDVVIRVDAYPTHTFDGRVERVSPLGKTDTSVVTFDVEIVITDEKANLLRSGMSADLEIVINEKKNVLLIPLMAVQSRGQARLVTLASGEQRRIEAGATDGSRIEVLEGLQEGDVLSLAGPAAAGSAPPASKGGGQRDMMRSMRGGGR